MKESERITSNKYSKVHTSKKFKKKKKKKSYKVREDLDGKLK